MKHIITHFDIKNASGREVLKGLAFEVQKSLGWQLQLTTSTKELEKAILEQVPDGIIGHFAHDKDRTQALSLPCPKIFCHCQTTSPDYAAIANDNHLIGRMAGEHLLESGFRSFIYLGPRDELFSIKREEAFRSYIESHAMQYRAFRLVHTEASLKRFAKIIVERQPRVAIFTYDDFCANHVIRFMLKLGLKPPEDYAILGVDNDLLQSQITAVPISSIKPDYMHMGQLAARYLSESMDDQPIPELTLIPPVDVIPRSSTQLTDQDPVLNAALQYIHQHACQRMTISRMAEEIGYSRSTIERRFKSILKRNTLDYIKSIQMEQAKLLLSQSNHSINEIASEVGYSDHRHFRSEFKSLAGSTPSTYRKKHKHKSS